MILWINGPFGCGKSSVAPLVAAGLPDALVVDPEAVGHMLWSQLPARLRQEEFEQEPVWPQLTRCLVEGMAAAYGRPLVIPMTLARPQVFDQIVGGMRRAGHDVRHVTLLAGAPTIRDRLRRRMAERNEPVDEWGELSWEGVQIARCLDVLSRPEFGTHVWNEGRPLPDVAQEILDTVASCATG